MWRKILMVICLALCLFFVSQIIINFISKQEGTSFYNSTLPSHNEVNIKQLKEDYPDIKGYIEIKGTNINYPVVQSDDNDYYLSHLPNGKKNKMGSIYLDYRNNAFNDDNMNYIVATPFSATNNFFLKSDKIHLLTYNFKFDSLLRKRNIVKAFKLLIKKEKIDVLHIQSGSTYVLLKISSLAKKHNIKKVIIHSHCAGEINLKYKIIKFLSDKKIDKLVDVYLACSDLAAIWKFPQKIIAEKNYTIIKNGIDTKKFTFSPQIRKEYREKFLLDDYLTLCNVGRLSEQKNQKFIIDVCKILLDKKINFKVFLVGEGELKEDIVSYIKNNSLTDKFILLEKRDDIEKIMMASDIFLLPSLYEGLAVTSIEAQCTGLLTLCSTNITDETKLTDIIEFLDITDAKLWTNKIAEYSNKLNDLNRSKYANIIDESGYDSYKSADLLEKIYRGLN